VLTPADPGWLRPLGTTGLTVSAVCLGGGPLGSMPDNFGYDVSATDAVDLVKAALAGPIRFLDTANGYSGGQSERRIGAGIAAFGGLPAGFVVATKVDACDGDYSGERVRMSVQESRQRLGLDHLPLVHLHDPEFHRWEDMTAPGGAVDALMALKESGSIGSIGLAGGHVPTMARYLELGVFDVLLVHNRWTLVDHSAAQLIEQAVERGVAVVNAAVYGGESSRGNRTTGTTATATGPRARKPSTPSARCGRCAPDTGPIWPRLRCSTRCTTTGSCRRSSGSARRSAWTGSSGVPPHAFRTTSGTRSPGSCRRRPPGWTTSPAPDRPGAPTPATVVPVRVVEVVVTPARWSMASARPCPGLSRKRSRRRKR